MREGLVSLPEGVVILKEKINSFGKIVDLVKWKISDIPESEADRINASIREIIESQSPSACRFHSIGYKKGIGITYRVAKVGSYLARRKGGRHAG